MRNLIYEPDEAILDIDALDEDFRDFGKGLSFIGDSVKEARTFSGALSKGILNTPLPHPENELAAPLKALHAAMKHLTWQSQQVAKGDYHQRIDFMGDFAEAFNTMTLQLDQRQRALEKEIQTTKSQKRALEQVNSLLEAVTDRIEPWIIVVSVDTNEIIFVNRSAALAIDEGGPLAESLRDWLGAQTDRYKEESSGRPTELVLPSSNNEMRYYSIVSYPLRWKEQDAVAHIITDISIEKKRVLKLENYAFQDSLTALYNRFYGMQILRQWLEERRHFCICFADLDNLKFVNDNYGHQEGDLYIIQTAEHLIDFSKDAVVCRLGGDEFMVLAEGYTQEEAEKRMEEIRAQMIKRNEKKEEPYYFSVSYGVVEAKPDEEYSPSELLALADERMYHYKRASKKERLKKLSEVENEYEEDYLEKTGTEKKENLG